MKSLLLASQSPPLLESEIIVRSECSSSGDRLGEETNALEEATNMICYECLGPGCLMPRRGPDSSLTSYCSTRRILFKKPSIHFTSKVSQCLSTRCFEMVVNKGVVVNRGSRTEVGHQSFPD